MYGAVQSFLFKTSKNSSSTIQVKPTQPENVQQLLFKLQRSVGAISELVKSIRAHEGEADFFFTENRNDDVVPVLSRAIDSAPSGGSCCVVTCREQPQSADFGPIFGQRVARLKYTLCSYV